MRLFVAAVLPEELVEALAETSAQLRGCVRGRYVAPDSFHVTLAFLGEVGVNRVDDAAGALERGCREFAPFEVAFGDFGSFGRRASATLWQGFSDAGDLTALAQSVRAELREVGFSFDEKSFLPHVTLMRAANLREGVLPMTPMARGVVSSVVLFRSDLSGSRPVYEPLHVTELRGSSKRGLCEG